MPELESLLGALARGDARLADVRAAIEAAIAQTPQDAPAMLARLSAARAGGQLSTADFDFLKRIIEDAANEEDRTTASAAPEASEDPTIINKDACDPDTSESAEADPDPDAIAFLQEGDDTTLISLDGNDATQTNVASEGDDRTQAVAPTRTEDDATLVTGPTGDQDATAVNVHAPDDRTVVTGAAADDGFDILSADAMDAVEQAAGGAGSTRELREGDVLKERFELLSKLGEGGMGAVWKAMDRLKQEARDRNPYVAVKLLQGDFKEHPEAFIALQRETSKQQRLAHPNIATVYDFDRDSDTVYMTMEVMDGQPMDRFVRKLPAGGLPEEEAMPLIEDICAGLGYAHEAGLVHSDLKPGNAFIVRDENPDRPHGRVKLFDFGIARASKTKTDAEGEATLFDPGALGALTPTYATIEMFEGEDPDPRDDIYALAIMAYQLFTGKHPYGRKSAPKAKELGLEPEPVDKLDKRQNRGFARALAFHREDRTPSVEAFLHDIRRRKSRVPMYLGAGIAATLLIGIAAYGPIVDEIHKREREEYITAIVQGDVAGVRAGLARVKQVESAEQRDLVLQDGRVREKIIGIIAQGDEPSIREALDIIQEGGLEALQASIKDDPRAAEFIGDFIARGDADSINTGLALIEPFDVNWQRVIKDQSKVKEAIIAFYTDRMYRTVDPGKGQYGYGDAEKELAALERIYPDSAEVFQVRNELEAKRQTELSVLNDRYNDLLERGMVVSDDQQDDIGDILAIVKLIDSEHPMLTDSRIPMRFADLASEAIQANDYPRAATFIEASKRYAPDDATLAGLRQEIEKELERQAEERLGAAITARLESAWPSFTSLDDYQGYREDMFKLSELRPTSPLLAKMSEALTKTVDAELDRLITAKEFDRSEMSLAAFARFLALPYLRAARVRLSSAEAEAGYQRPSSEERANAIGARKRDLLALIEKPEFGDRWEFAVQWQMRELAVLQSDPDPAITGIRDALAELYLGRARQTRADNRFNDARELVRLGQEIHAEFPGFEDEVLAIARDEEALRMKREEERRLARIEAMKTSLLAKASANHPEEAEEILAALREELRPSDPFMTSQGPDAIGEAYRRLAAAVAERNDFDAALAFVRAGLDLSPGLESLRINHEVYLSKLLDLAQDVQIPTATRDLHPSAVHDGAETRASGPTGLSGAPAESPFGQVFRAGTTPVAVLAKLDPPITEFTPGVVDRYPALAEGPAMQSADRITSLADAEPIDFNTLAAPLAGYRVLYPDRASRLDDRVARRLEKRVGALLEQTPLQVAALGRPLEGFAELFPDRSGALRETVAFGLERRIKALTDAGPAQLASLSTPLSEFSVLFPARSDGLRKSVATRLEEQIKGLAEKALLDLAPLESPLKIYGALFPDRLAALTDNVGARVAERIQATRPATPENFASLVKPLEQFERLFAARYPALETSLAARAAKEIRRLQPRDVYKADALKRASLKALPGSEAITAIRLELPSPEIIDGKKLLAAGRVTAASKKLDEAVATDPQHSDIPPFREALEARMKRAKADYDTYVSNVSQRKERTQSQRLYASATKLWVDNPAFIKVEEPRAGACKAYLAGYGGSKRSTCYDFVSKRQKGPLMVVVPAGGLFKAPYAIGKYEVTVADFNRYCRATKACKVAPRNKSKLPVTGISLEQAENYARWLSKQASATEKTEVVYRLPTESEWDYAAKAAGKQPQGKKFNCRVKSGSDIIKGHALVDAQSGQKNGWGVTNYIGNAREWAKGSSGVVVLGGAFEDSLTECSLSLKRSHSGDADDLTGFRLVREIRG